MAKLKHLAIATQQPDETAAFYRDVFDLEDVGRVDTENAEGYLLSDGSVNIAIVRFKNPVLVGDKFDSDYAGLHHIGFKVPDTDEWGERLKRKNSHPLSEINDTLHAQVAAGGRVEIKYEGPDGVMVDISQTGWAGTDDD